MWCGGSDCLSVTVAVLSAVMTMELARFWIHEGAESRMLAERPAMVDAPGSTPLTSKVWLGP